jgi:hypothetical protein
MDLSFISVKYLAVAVRIKTFFNFFCYSPEPVMRSAYSTSNTPRKQTGDMREQTVQYNYTKRTNTSSLIKLYLNVVNRKYISGSLWSHW